MAYIGLCMIDTSAVKQFFRDWKEVLTVGMSAGSLAISIWTVFRDRKRASLEKPRFDFTVWISPYADTEAYEKAHKSIFKNEQRAALAEAQALNWAVHIKATNRGIQPVTVEYGGCMVTYVGVRGRHGVPGVPEKSEIAIQERKVKLEQGDTNEWIMKFACFPYRILRVLIFNTFQDVWCAPDSQVLDLHRKNVHRWPYTDARLSLLARPIGYLFLWWWKWRFRPQRVRKSDNPAEASWN